MKKKERLVTAALISGRLIVDILLKKPKQLVFDEARLAKWHWGKLFKK